MCGRHLCYCHNLASPSGEWVRVPKVTSNCSSVSISTVISPQSQPFQDSAAASTCGRGPGLVVGLFEFHFLGHVTWSCWLPALVSKVWQSWGRFLKWSDRGDSTRGRRLVFMFTKQVSVVDHLIINRHSLPLASASCLPSCTAIRLVFNKLQARMLLKWWRRNWLSPYGFSIFVISILYWGSFCFPLAELELFMASLKMAKQSMRAC